MKAYQKAEMIAKNLPTGSYSAGCPTHSKPYEGAHGVHRPKAYTATGYVSCSCSDCEIAN